MKALPSRPELRAWMAETRTGYKKAAKHFGASEGDLRSVMGAKSSRTPTRARETEAKRRTKLGPLAWRIDKLEQLETGIHEIMKSERINAVGLAALTKSAMKLRGEIDALSAVASDEFGNMSRDEIREYLGTLLEEWPDEFIELAFLVYAEKHGGRVVFVAEGGRQTEYDAAEGWREVGSD